MRRGIFSLGILAVVGSLFASSAGAAPAAPENPRFAKLFAKLKSLPYGRMWGGSVGEFTPVGWAQPVQIAIAEPDFTLTTTQTELVTDPQLAQLRKAALAPHEEIDPTADVTIYPLAEGPGSLEQRREVDARGAVVREKWLLHHPVEVGRFPLTEWSAFIRASRAHGLEQFHYDDGFGAKPGQINLVFRARGPDRFGSSAATLRLPSNFYSHARILRDVTPSVGPKGLVILVLDPHNDYKSQYDIVSALHELRSQNPGQKWQFLDEGDYEQPDRTVPWHGLDTAFKGAAVTAGSGASLAGRLLKHSLVDGAMAYRLQFEPDLPTFAIDERAFFPKGDDPDLEYNPSIAAIQALVTYARTAKTPGLLVAAKNWSAVLADLERASRASWFRTGTHGARRVTYHLRRRAAIETLLSQAKRLQSTPPDAEYQEDIDTAQDALAAFSKGCDALENYGKRDRAMAKHIVERCTDPGVVSFAFVGAFHLAGISEDLKAAHLGVIAVEARSNPGWPSLDWDDALYERPMLLHRMEAVRRSGFKIPVGPTAAEAPSYARILSREADELGRSRQQERANYAKQAQPARAYEEWREALDRNSETAECRLEFGPSEAPLPEVPGEARAFAEWNYTTKTFRIFNAADPRWAGPERMTALRQGYLCQRSFLNTRCWLNGDLYEISTLGSPGNSRIFFLEKSAQAAQNSDPALFLPKNLGNARPGYVRFSRRVVPVRRKTARMG